MTYTKSAEIFENGHEFESISLDQGVFISRCDCGAEIQESPAASRAGYGWANEKAFSHCGTLEEHERS
jgi:hypothetical protein